MNYNHASLRDSHLKRLNEATFVCILNFVDFFEVGSLMLVSTFFCDFIYERDFWRKVLNSRIPNYFSNKEFKSSYVCNQRLKNWIDELFEWQIIGETTEFRKRFLHRCVTMFNHNSFVFGGETSDFSILNEIFHVNLNQDKDTVCLARVKCSMSSSIMSAEALPRGRRACAVCAVGNNMLIFGGATTSNLVEPFSSEFLRLSVYPDGENFQLVSSTDYSKMNPDDFIAAFNSSKVHSNYVIELL